MSFKSQSHASSVIKLNMLQQFSQHISNNLSFLKNKTIGVAISGGVDSVVLTYLLKQIGCKLVFLHCNFKLRETESEKDANFVRSLAEKWEVGCFVKDFKTKAYAEQKKLSIQLAARELRYNWFFENVESGLVDVVVTAHHLDDQLETFLINLSRGTGIEGLTGIPKVNDYIVRPLLVFSKQQILAYAENQGLVWREDQSNKETKYLRNQFRHLVIPSLKETNAKFLDNFKNTLDHLNQSNQVAQFYFSEKVKAYSFFCKIDQVIKWDIAQINKEPFLETFLFEAFKSYGFTSVKDIQSLLNAQSGKYIESDSYKLLKDRDYLLLYSNAVQKNNAHVVTVIPSVLELSKGGNLSFEYTSAEAKSNKNLLLVDEAKIELPLIVRKWQEGDYFYPEGMLGKKKLSKYFKDEKYSMLQKEQTWILCDQNQVLWIIGKRKDRRALANAKTQKNIKITVSYENED